MPPLPQTYIANPPATARTFAQATIRASYRNSINSRSSWTEPHTPPAALVQTTSKLASPRLSPLLHLPRAIPPVDNIRARSASVRISQSRGEELDKEKGGVYNLGSMLVGSRSWRPAKVQLPPARQIVHAARSTRFLVFLAVVTAIVLLSRSIGSAAEDMQRYAKRVLECDQHIARFYAGIRQFHEPC